MDQLSASFSSMWVTVRLTSLGCLQFWAGLLPVVAAAQTLIWSYSCMFLLSCLYLPVLVCFLLQELSLSFIYSIDTKSARWSCGFNLQLVPLVGMFWFYSLDTCPWISLVVFISTFACESSTGVYSWGSPGGLGCAPGRTKCGGGAVAWIAGALAVPGTKGSHWLGQQEIWSP